MAPLPRRGPVWVGIRPVSLRTRVRPPGATKRDHVVRLHFFVGGWWDRRFFMVAGK